MEDKKDVKGVRLPPQNIDAERSVIGAVLISKDALLDVGSLLEAEDFYSKHNRLIYEAILELLHVDSPVDVITVSDKLLSKGLLEEVGGSPYIASLADEVPLASNAKQYALIVIEKSLQRKLIQASYDISKLAYEPGGDVQSTLEEAEQIVFNAIQKKSRKSYTHIGPVLTRVYDRFEEISRKGGLPGVSTGFYDLDKLLSGMQDSDLILVAARPGMGKTAFMLNIAQHVAVKEKLPVALFNLEMSNEQLAIRMLSSSANVAGSKLRSGDISDSDWKKLATGVGHLSSAPIYFDDSTEISVSAIRAKCRKLKLEQDIKLVVVDYIQLMSGSKKSENRVQEVSDISRSLKLLARELDIPVIVGSQLSRDVEKRADKRPVLSDLRESGAIEQDADLVMFLYRDDYYNEDSEFKNVAEVILAKHRNGPTGKLNLMFDPEHISFKNIGKSE